MQWRKHACVFLHLLNETYERLTGNCVFGLCRQRYEWRMSDHVKELGYALVISATHAAAAQGRLRYHCNYVYELMGYYAVHDVNAYGRQC